MKSNIGHLEGTSGIAGIIKAIAMLERGVIPKIADLRSVNPRIDEDYLKIQVVFAFQNLYPHMLTIKLVPPIDSTMAKKGSSSYICKLLRVWGIKCAHNLG